MEPKVLAEIKQHASRAAKELDILMNRLTIANAIHWRFPETPLQDIVDQLSSEWRRRDLFFTIVHR